MAPWVRDVRIPTRFAVVVAPRARNVRAGIAGQDPAGLGADYREVSDREEVLLQLGLLDGGIEVDQLDG